MSRMQAIPSEMFTKEQIFQLTRSPKPWGHCSFPKQIDPATLFGLISRRVYRHPLKMYTYIFIFVRNPRMIDTGWITNLNYVIMCASDTRNTNNSHLLIAGGVGVAQQCGWDPFGAEQRWNYEVAWLQREQVCAPHLFPYSALDHKCYLKCQMLNNI